MNQPKPFWHTPLGTVLLVAIILAAITVMGLVLSGLGQQVG